jgi:hypothetical protein
MMMRPQWDTIVYFREVAIGKDFASTKTGQEYRKISDSTGVDRMGATETFAHYFLVYIAR